ncbi:unnamed protein product [Rhizophagus irregularis]|nr:unnamed protein product [Rhizophagus irregularis]
MNAFTSSSNAGTVKTAMVFSSSSSSSSNVICEEEKLTSSLSLAGMKFSCGGGFGSTVPSGRMLPICNKETFTSSLSLSGVKFNCGGVDSAISSGRMLPIMLTSSLPLGGVKFDCDGKPILLRVLVYKGVKNVKNSINHSWL